MPLHSLSMVYFISSAISSRMLQVHQVARWRRPKLSMSNADDCAAIRRYCTCLIVTMEAAVENLTPQEFGTLSSILRKGVLTLAILMAQSPTDEQIRAFNLDLQGFVESRCPNFDICDTCLGELADFVRTVMRLQCEADPEFATRLAQLREMQSYEQICEAADLNRGITARINMAIFHELLPILHEDYGFRQMVSFTRAYRREDFHHNNELPLPLIRPIEFIIDDTEAEHRGVGNRIELSAFCKPVELVPDGTECSVCLTEIDGTEQDTDEQPVVTNCSHTFHKLCLDKWVNDSGMKASNKCPSCRTVLCRPRGRRHASMEDSFNSESNDGDSMSPAETSSIESTESVVRVQWLESRMVSGSSLVTETIGNDDASDADDSSFASGNYDETMPPQQLFEILRAERVANMHVVDS